MNIGVRHAVAVTSLSKNCN